MTRAVLSAARNARSEVEVLQWYPDRVQVGKGLDLARRKCLLEHMKAALLILLFGSLFEDIARQVVHRSSVSLLRAVAGRTLPSKRLARQGVELTVARSDLPAITALRRLDLASVRR